MTLKTYLILGTENCDMLLDDWATTSQSLTPYMTTPVSTSPSSTVSSNHPPMMKIKPQVRDGNRNSWILFSYDLLIDMI